MLIFATLIGYILLTFFKPRDDPLFNYNLWFLVDWKVRTFIKTLLNQIQKYWHTVFSPTLVISFEFASLLYAIFYTGVVLTETIMEVWDPCNFNKPSEVFKITHLSEKSPLSNIRTQAKVLQMTNIQY